MDPLLSGFLSAIVAPVSITTIGCWITYKLSRRSNRESQNRPLVLTTVVIPLARELRRTRELGNRADTYEIQRILQLFEANHYFNADLRREFKEYVDLCETFRRAGADLDRSLQEAFWNRLTAHQIPFSTESSCGPAEWVGRHWLSPQFDVEATIRPDLDPTHNPGAQEDKPAALMGGIRPVLVFFVDGDTVRERLEELRRAAHEVIQEFQHDQRRLYLERQLEQMALRNRQLENALGKI